MNKLLEKPDFHVACAEYAELDRAWNSALFSPVSRYIPWTRLYFPLSGEGKIEFNGKTTIIKRGKLILVPPCAKIHVSCDDSLNKFWMHFSAQSFKHGTELFSLFDDVAVLDLNEDEFAFTEKLFRIVYRHYRIYKPAGNNENPLEEQSAKSALLLMLEPFLLKLVKFTDEPDFFRILDVMSYLNSNLNRHITLKELGQHANMHPNYFSALFKKQTGVPPITYLNILRRNRALMELQRGNLRISEIAELVGSANPAAFSKMIRKTTGVSPREYRQAMKNNSLAASDGFAAIPPPER